MQLDFEENLLAIEDRDWDKTYGDDPNRVGQRGEMVRRYPGKTVVEQIPT
jgi:hypothetical protein